MKANVDKVKWGIDPVHSEVGFKVSHLKISSISGVFTQYDASIYTEGENFMTAAIDFYINPDSVDTRNAERDAHLRGSDFFDVENFKEISFIGNTYEAVDKESSYDIYGDLTIKGVKRQVKLQVEFGGIVKDPWGNEKAVFNVHGKINRKEWGLNWNLALDTGGFLVGDEVALHVQLQLVRQSN